MTWRRRSNERNLHQHASAAFANPAGVRLTREWDGSSLQDMASQLRDISQFRSSERAPCSSAWQPHGLHGYPGDPTRDKPSIDAASEDSKAHRISGLEHAIPIQGGGDLGWPSLCSTSLDLEIFPSFPHQSERSFSVRRCSSSGALRPFDPVRRTRLQL